MRWESATQAISIWPVSYTHLQMATTGQVDNYPGFEDGIDGFELGEKMKKGADRFGAETAFDEVISVELQSEPKKITTTGGELLAKTVVIAKMCIRDSFIPRMHRNLHRKQTHSPTSP